MQPCCLPCLPGTGQAYSYNELENARCPVYLCESFAKKKKESMNEINSEAAAAERLYDICQRLYSCSLEDFKALIERFPNAVHVGNANNSLPLHYACRFGFSEVIPILLESWPQSVQIANKYGSLPLHYACEGALSLTVMQSLIQMWPDAIHMQCSSGWLPLHIACVYRHTQAALSEVFQFLLNCWPKSVRCRTINGELPLHLACSEGQSFNY